MSAQHLLLQFRPGVSPGRQGKLLQRARVRADDVLVGGALLVCPIGNADLAHSARALATSPAVAFCLPVAVLATAHRSA